MDNKEHVHEFGKRMIKKLDANNDRPGWDNYNVYWLLDRLKQELDELEQAINAGSSNSSVKDECADVANFAMMISENYRQPEMRGIDSLVDMSR